MDAMRRLAGRLSGHGARDGAQGDHARQFRDNLFATFPFTDEAQEELRRDVTLVVHDVSTTSGGGYWWPEQRKVEFFTGQYEAAIHEYAHAWWHDRRLVGGAARRLMDAVQRLADERDPSYADTARLAH